jgi:hypothetical protein
MAGAPRDFPKKLSVACAFTWLIGERKETPLPRVDPFGAQQFACHQLWTSDSEVLRRFDRPVILVTQPLFRRQLELCHQDFFIYLLVSIYF